MRKSSLLQVVAVVACVPAPLFGQTGTVLPGVAAIPGLLITGSSNGQTVKVRVGDDVTVALTAAGGTGYTWELRPPISDVVTASGVSETEPTTPGLPGGPVTERFHMKVSKAGTVKLTFAFSRSWDKTSPAAKTFTVTLRAE